MSGRGSRAEGEQKKPSEESSLLVTLPAWARRLLSRPAVLYYAAAGIMIASYAIWFNFSAPPIGSNSTFVLYPWRHVNLALSLFNPYYWPGSFTPQAIGTPVRAFYGVWFTASNGSYSVATFLTIVPLDAAAAVCLFYLTSRWLVNRGFSEAYGLLPVAVYSFNVYNTLSGYGTYAGYFSEGPFSPGDPAFLIILGFLMYLTLYRDRRYAIAVGLVSILPLSYFPNSTLIFGEEFLALLLVAVIYRCFAFSARDTQKARRKAIIDALTILGSVVIANAYILLPLALMSGVYTSSLVSSSPSYAYSFSFDSIELATNSIRLVSNWWIATPEAPGWARSYLTNPIVILLSTVLPALALLSVIFARRVRDLCLYATMLLVILASIGPNPPTGMLFMAVVTNVPIFRGFYNAELFSPILVVLYGLFATYTIAEISTRVSRINTIAFRAEASPVQCGRWTTTPKNSQRLSALITCVLVGVLVASAYPALTPAFASGSPGFPSSSSLPTSYLEANEFLQASNPFGPVMVFPDSAPFTALEQDNSTWFNGPNTFPTILPNPSISSDLPANFVGSGINTMAPSAFVYHAVGASICPADPCGSSTPNLIPQLAEIQSNQSPQLVTQNNTTVQWAAGTAGDTVSFEGAATSPSMVITVNTSNYMPNGHWVIGTFPEPKNLSNEIYVLITMNATMLNASDLEFGFHSGSEYGSGDAYRLNTATVFDKNASSTYLLSLGSPSIRDDGNLSNVWNLFFTYLAPPNATGLVSFDIHSLRFSAYSSPLPLGWNPTYSTDSTQLVSTQNSTSLDFVINQAAQQGEVHWTIGTLPQPVNFSIYRFAIVTFSTNGLSYSSLQFGYHTVPGRSGAAFVPTDYLLRRSAKGEETAIIDLSQPTIDGGGNLGQVADIFFNYAVPRGGSGTGFLNVSSVKLLAGDSGGKVLASDLGRFGIEFVYVDTGIVSSLTPTRVGNYYNKLFGGSTEFTRVFTQGTITIYRNNLFHGIFSLSDNVTFLSPTNATLQGLSVPYANVYYNTSNSALTYVSQAVYSPTAVWGRGSVLSTAMIAPTQYQVRIDNSGWSILVSRLAFDPRWTATIVGGATLRSHVMVDAFANGWLAPPGNYTVLVSLTGQSHYQTLELFAFSAPVILLGVLIATTVWRRSRGPSSQWDRILGPRIPPLRSVPQRQANHINHLASCGPPRI